MRDVMLVIYGNTEREYKLPVLRELALEAYERIKAEAHSYVYLYDTIKIKGKIKEDVCYRQYIAETQTEWINERE